MRHGEGREKRVLSQHALAHDADENKISYNLGGLWATTSSSPLSFKRPSLVVWKRSRCPFRNEAEGGVKMNSPATPAREWVESKDPKKKFYFQIVSSIPRAGIAAPLVFSSSGKSRPWLFWFATTGFRNARCSNFRKSGVPRPVTYVTQSQLRLKIKCQRYCGKDEQDPIQRWPRIHRCHNPG